MAIEEPETYQVNPLVFRIHIFSALWFVWIAGILEVKKGLTRIIHEKLKKRKTNSS